MNPSRAFMILFTFLWPIMADGQVSVTNAGFEAVALSDGGFTINTFGGGWVGRGGGNAGLLNPSTSMFTSEAPEGLNVAYTNGRDICQTVGTVENNGFYEAMAMAGVRLDVGGLQNCGIELRSTSGVRCRDESNPAPVDSFATISCSFTAGPADVDQGQPLELCFTKSGGVQCNFDTVTALPVELLSFAIE